jgi:hypothetical protein
VAAQAAKTSEVEAAAANKTRTRFDISAEHRRAYLQALLSMINTPYFRSSIPPSPAFDDQHPLLSRINTHYFRSSTPRCIILLPALRRCRATLYYLVCVQSFAQCDSNRDGFIDADEARELLTQSGLPNGILAQIWTLSDLDRDGKLNESEFVIAMALVNRGAPSTQPNIYVYLARIKTDSARIKTNKDE